LDRDLEVSTLPDVIFLLGARHCGHVLRCSYAEYYRVLRKLNSGGCSGDRDGDGDGVWMNMDVNGDEDGAGVRPGIEMVMVLECGCDGIAMCFIVLFVDFICLTAFYVLLLFVIDFIRFCINIL
jgi:hypothetical protein